MLIEDLPGMIVEQRAIASRHLKRQVVVDLYLPKAIVDPAELSLLLLNDGQDLEDMPYAPLVEEQMRTGAIGPLVTAGIHANKHRKSEYGVASQPDFAGRGDRADAHRRFVVDELIPFIQKSYAVPSFRQVVFGGFSLGGLSAIDIAWAHPELFSAAAVFSGSLWWRSRDLGEGYHDDQHRIIHQVIRAGSFHPGQRFYFTTGSLDETADRNANGIIDSIDDTEDLIRELKAKGYGEEDIRYINFEDGRHDVATWARALPDFLRWCFGSAKEEGETREALSTSAGESC